MKKLATKVSAILASLLLACSALFSMPVKAGGLPPVDPGTEWWDVIWGGGDWLTKSLWGAVWSMAEDAAWEEATRQTEWLKANWEAVNKGELPYNAPHDFQVLNTPKNYYSSVGGGLTASGGGGGGGARGEASAYQSGEIVYTPIVSQSYNNTTNNYEYNINIPTTNYNNTTNNYYDTYNIQNIYYNQQYNTYNFETTNNYNYYVTYSPTYVNITYLDSARDTIVNNSYFYQLPDGRNSFDLTAEDVWGQYFVYPENVLPYQLVVEDEATLGLYHFDGNLKDDSAYSGTATYSGAASHNYVDHGAFGSALYWDNQAFQLDFKGAGTPGTIEFMLYLTQAGSVSVPLLRNTYTATGGAGQYATSLARPGFSYFLMSDYATSTDTISGITTTTKEWKKAYDTLEQEMTAKAAFSTPPVYVLNVNGKGYIPVTITAWINCTVKYITYYQNDNGYGISSSSMTVTASVSGVRISAGHSSLSIGTWHSIAVSGGQLYVDGVAVNGLQGTSSRPGICIAKHGSWGNYWMLDEVRMSAGNLYTSNYTPSAQPYDTNKVLVLPDGGEQGQVAIKTNIPITDTRFGGVRPTYPTVGDVYVYLESDKVKSVQQYQDGGWVLVDGAIYDESEWIALKDYDMNGYTIDPFEPPDPPDPPPDPGSSSSSDPGSSSSSSGPGSSSSSSGPGSSSSSSDPGNLPGEVSGLWDTIKGTLFGLGQFMTDFGAFIGEAFSFIPPEVMAVIVLALSLAVVLMIINFFR